jgi:soluble lytic murein transglycosylase
VRHRQESGTLDAAAPVFIWSVDSKDMPLAYESAQINPSPSAPMQNLAKTGKENYEECDDQLETEGMTQRPFARVVSIVLFFAVSVALVLLVSGYLWRQWRRERLYDSEIQRAAERYRIDPALVKAVIWQESRFDSRAKGRAGEIGLMQVQEIAAEEWAEAERLKDFTHAQLWNPERNIHAGAWYLSKALKRYTNTDNPVPYALADYNAGRAHVLRWNKGAAATNSEAFLAQMDYPGTRKYALNVMNRYRHYRERAVK